MITLTEEQVQTITETRTDHNITPRTQQNQIHCNHILREESEILFKKIGTRLGEHPEGVHENYTFLKTEFYSFGNGRLKVQMKADYKVPVKKTARMREDQN